MRADQLLVERGLAVSRSQAQRLISAGVHWRVPSGEWKPVSKNGEVLREGVELQLADVAEIRFVSRGGLKLAGALDHVSLDVFGLRCMDVGQSTGGFTDCLLQRGAAAVVGVDVGQGQLHPRLRGDARVVCVEKCNARDLSADLLLQMGGPSAGAPFDLVVGDLSFISQTLVWPALVPLLGEKGRLLMLVKPQFELQPEHIGKGGLVRDFASYGVVETRIKQACADNRLSWIDYFESPITGGDGNREFFVYAHT
ncbi:TlyA family RNA methyltransferase [Hydrogenophaga sp.]|uniref:TlyA family RNA methyltransferase n=1 Tax=Hydrogenophaga sp. TaxID=1904254 RepID=UPI00271A6102|nr:TlyA family RNA methyltransferase [Hydrogenophaga sp.]MDO8904366.1 TlyA family RNA methyltransferase [Hydrogenophaga sp.]